MSLRPEHYFAFAAILTASFAAAAMWWRNVQTRQLLVKFEESAQQERREKQMVVEFLHAITKDIDAGKGREELYPAIVRAAVRGTGALGAKLYEIDRDGNLAAAAATGFFPALEPVPASLLRPDTLRSDLLAHALLSGNRPARTSILGSVAKDGKPVFIPFADSAEPSGYTLADDPVLRVRSLIVVPITSGKRTLGVLAVANPEHGAHFDQGDFAFVKSLGEQCAVALHLHEMFQLRSEKNKLDFDLSIASGVQKLLLPQKLPSLPGLEVHACYRPAKQVGGDLYDVADMGDGRLGIIAADVSGKGVPASLVMAMAHTHLRHLMRGETTPVELLRRLNADMVGEIQRGMFITIACAIIDTNRHTLTLARAGHELPLLLTRSEGPSGPRFEKIRTEGMAIGIVPPEIFDTILTEVTLPFRPGSVLVFFTDGLTEARNPAGDEYGTENLARTVLRSHQAGARDLSQEILSSLENFCEGVTPHDDLTLVTVKCVK